MTLYALIADFVRRHARDYAYSALMLAGVAVLTVWIPRHIGQIVDALIAHRLAPASLARELALLVAAGVVIYFLRVGWRLRLFAAAYRLGVELRTRLYARLALHGPRFFQQRRTGDLMAMATNDIDAIEMASGEAMLAGFDGTLTLVLVLAMMTLAIDWRLALVALLPFPLMGMAFWWISRKVHTHWRDSLDHFGHLNDHVQETLSGVRTVRALGLEARSSARFAELAGHARDASFEAQRWEAAYEPAVGTTLAAATVLTLAMGGYLVWHDELTVGTLTAFSMYLGQLIWPMFAAGWVLSLIERGKAAWNRIRPVLDEPPQVGDDGPRTAFEPGDLVAHGLHFSYPGQRDAALRDFSMRLPAGRTLGLVGPTGAGKSTLLRLILRQYDPDAGSLRWGDAALDELQLATLRGALSWVPQEAFLFSATLAENIALARPDAPRAAIEEAARLAAIHDDILRFPAGYDTPVGERGITLSGGQRQRIAIARALLTDTPLLLLDDALSAVDTDTETRILAHLRDTRRGRTAIIVSHRLSAVMDADHIVVLREGRITEQGSHAQLVALGGWYAAQWRYQQLEASLETA
jgi:ATP-binding cassette subfamily B protein/ATP-binding cassette subfamily C protein/ATP-binding cassette subfamily B multidrug efflux pump